MAMGDPWGSAADAYGQGLNNLVQINTSGINQRANAPMQLYQMFMDSYQKAHQMKLMDEESRQRQANIDRQNRLAELAYQKDQENEAWRRTTEKNKLLLDANNDIAKTVENSSLEYTPEMRDAIKMKVVNSLVQSGVDKASANMQAEKYLPGLKAQEIPNVSIDGGESVPLLPSDWRTGAGTTALDTFKGRNVRIEEENARKNLELENAKLALQALQERRQTETERHNLKAEAQRDTQLGAMVSKLLAKDKATTIEDATPAEMKLVDMIGTYRGLPEKIIGRGQDRARILAMVGQKYPSYDVGQAAQHYKFLQDLGSTRVGTAGGTVNSSNRMMEHASDLLDVINKQGGASGWAGKIANVATYPMQMMTGNEESFNAIRDKLLSETEKLVSGGVPHVEQMRRDVENLKFTDPIDKKKQILSRIVDLGVAQTSALEEQRKNILREQDPGTTFLSPKSLERVNKLRRESGRPEIKASTTSSGYGIPPEGSSNPTNEQPPPRPGKVDGERAQRPGSNKTWIWGNGKWN